MKIRVGRGVEVVVGIVVYIVVVVGGGGINFRDGRCWCGSCVVVLLFELSIVSD